jgi:hypothetical protein
MINRIEQWWKDVLKWKERFESIGTNSSQNRFLLREQLRKYEQITSAKIKNPTIDEKISKKKLLQEKKVLEKMLYPNSILRSIRNLQLVFGKIDRTLGFSNTDPNTINLQQPKFRTQLEKLGVSPSSIPATINFLSQKPTSELLPDNQILHTRIIISEDRRRLDGLQFSINLEGNQERRIFLDSSSTINKSYAINLLQGRPVYVNDKWLIPDLNDRDRAGNIKLNEISITNFDIAAEIQKIPGLKISNDKLSEMVSALLAGKRAELNTKKYPGLTIEANPLKRSLHFIKDNKKVKLDGSSAIPAKMKIAYKNQVDGKWNKTKLN